MNRRNFINLLSAGIAGAAIDPEQFGWTKTKTIFIPPAQSIYSPKSINIVNAFIVGDVLSFAGRYARDPITHQPTKHLQYFIVTATNENGFDLKPVPLP